MAGVEDTLGSFYWTKSLHGLETMKLSPHFHQTSLLKNKTTILSMENSRHGRLQQA